MPTIRMTAAMLTMCALSACADPHQATDDPVATQDSPLLLWSGATKWPNGTVYTCFTAHAMQHRDSAGQSDFATLSQFIQDKVADTWGRVADVRFVGWGACPSSPQGVVAIDLVDDTAGNAGGLGYPGSSSFFLMHLGVSRSDFFGSLVPHEFGHTLGFAHEQTRSDFVDDPSGSCRGDDTTGDPLGTPPDRQSIMASTGYCQENANLSPWDIVGVQNAYHRKPAGTIVGLHNRCVDIPLDGPPPPVGQDLQVFDCNAGSNQKWRWTSASQLYAPGYASSFMDDEGGTGANQSSVQIYTQNSPVSSNQQFSFTGVSVRAIGETCIDVPGSNYANNQLLQIYGCHGGANQRWDVGADGTIRNGGYCWDIPYGATATGTRLQIYACNGGSNQRFSFTSAGELRFGGQCVDVIGGAPTDGSQLQLYPCKSESDSSKMNQRFHLTGPVHSMGRCLDIRGGASFNGASLQIYNCLAGAANQTWDYYFSR